LHIACSLESEADAIAEAPMIPRLKYALTRFLRKEEGVTAVECALMLALVVVICLVALAPLTPSTSTPAPVVTLEHDRG
jgi:Flp pilus assembly pilin Flp